MIPTDYLATFGDSWPYGVGLVPPFAQQTYGRLLCDMLQIPNFYNGAVPGSSVSRLLLQLFDYIKLHNDTKNHIAIFFITSPGRNMTIDWRGQVHDLNRPGLDESPESLSSKYYRYFSTVPMDQFNLTRDILALQQVCWQAQIQDYYINGWADPPTYQHGIDTNKIYPRTCAQMLGYLNEKEFLNHPPRGTSTTLNENVLPCGHPNLQGHRLIADALYNWIKK